MKTENNNTPYRHSFPKFTFKERMQILGYARYLGYEFDYNPKKRKALLINTDNGTRKVLYLAKISGSIISIDKDGKKENLNDIMYVTKIMYQKGIFKIPETFSINVNDYIKENLLLIAQ